jgi:hypothetical protein
MVVKRPSSLEPSASGMGLAVQPSTVWPTLASMFRNACRTHVHQNLDTGTAIRQQKGESISVREAYRPCAVVRRKTKSAFTMWLSFLIRPSYS